MKMNIPLTILALCLNLAVFTACNKKEILEPQKPALPALSDPIPYEALGSGTIVFERIGPAPGEYSGCYVIDINQRKTRALDLGNCASYRVSPDGEWIVFSKYSGLATEWDIYKTDISGNHLQILTTLKGFERCPSWSPDGTRIFFWFEGEYPPRLYAQSPVPEASDLQKIRDLTYFSAGNQILLLPSGAVTVAGSGAIAFVT